MAVELRVSSGTAADDSFEYDPFTAGQTDDPYGEYRRLRDEYPLYYSEGCQVYAVWGYEDVRAVSRDWELFPALRRSSSTHRASPSGDIALGDGIHHCMGAAIARFDAQVAVRAILDRLLSYEIRGPLERIRSHMMNGYTSIPVTTGL
jgi:cytochrome P450